MSFKGTVINGVVVLDGMDSMPEGTRVDVIPEKPTVATGSPADAAEQRDAYAGEASKKRKPSKGT